jgi:hypothetical protein
MTTMVLTFIIGFVLASYLYLIRYQNVSVVRAQTWNLALPVAEAGIEEALAHIHQNGPGSAGPGSPGNLRADNWTLGANGYVKQSNLSSNEYYVVTISTAMPPTITSRGYALMPGSSTYISRAVQITTTNAPLFSTALAARFGITMNGNGNGVAADSFNSADPNLNNNGQYDPSKVSTNGDVASVYGTVDLGNHTIEGDLFLGPTAKFNGSTGQVSGTVYSDFNIDFPDVVLPASASTWAIPGAANQNVKINDGTTYAYAFFTSDDYVISTSGSIYVGTNAHVRLNVTANNFSPNCLRVAGVGVTAGQLTIYMSGASSSIGGTPKVDSGNAANFIYYGLPSNTSITYGGNSSFVGVIYAPEADLTLNGGGNDVGLVGASTTKTVRISGDYDFHYDENLRNVGPSRGYLMASWVEL